MAAPEDAGFGATGGLIAAFGAPRDSRMMRLGLVEEAKVSRLITLAIYTATPEVNQDGVGYRNYINER
jgi:hypothetical protein